MLTSDFDFNLPPELIAQQPFFPKEQTRMLVFRDGEIEDKRVLQLVDFLSAGDLLVFNDVRVIKAFLKVKILRNSKEVSLNLDQEIRKNLWQALCRGSKKVKDGNRLQIAEDFFCTVQKKLENGFLEIEFDCDDLVQKLEKHGLTPLPPYIKRDGKNEADDKNYQTIYAAQGMAAAAPTAGLHFNDKIFSLLKDKKIQTAFVTLNVGAGTFLPVKSESVLEHKMHSESFFITKETAQIINETKLNGGRIVAVGTTALRALESSANARGEVVATDLNETRHTKIFIYPGYQFKVIDGLVTNFHLPKSTLFMLVCALIGKENAHRVYAHAIAQQYRFYSYGDCSLLMRS